MLSRVINGEHKGWGVKTIIRGNIQLQRFSQKISIDSENIESYEIISQSEGKSSLGKTIGLGALFGTAGALVGANSKKGGGAIVKVTWKNGKRSMIEFDPQTFKKFLEVCPL